MLRRWVAPVAGYAAVAVASTWPLAADLSRLPLGSERTATVPRFNLWTMEWNVDRIAHAYSGYWHAPIFHPVRGAFALSDPQPLTGVAAAVLHLLVTDGATVYGLVLLGALVLNGFAAMRLVERFGVSRPAAWLTGVLALGLPFVFHELGVLQLVMIFPFFFALAALHDLGTEPTLFAGARIGLWTGVAFLTSEYYGLFLLVVLAIALPIVLGRRLGERVVLGSLLAALGCAVLLAAALLIPQAHFTARYRWTTTTVTENSASPADYVSVDPGALGGSVVPWLRSDTAEHLSPGTGVDLLAAAGLVVAWATGRRRWAVFLGAGVLLAVLLSLGLHLEVAAWAPYSVLRDHVPGFSRLRSPFRFAVVAQVLLVVLAGFALHRLWSWRGRVGAVLASLVVVVAVGEGLFLPAALARRQPDPATAGWVRFLRAHPGGAVAMIPFPETDAVEDYEPTTRAMLAALEHGHPLVNGYSGFFPQEYFDLASAMQGFPQLGIGSLRLRDVRWVVIDRHWLAGGSAAAVAAQPALLRAHTDPGFVVYRLTGSG